MPAPLSPTSIHQGPGRLWLYVPEPAHGNRLVRAGRLTGTAGRAGGVGRDDRLHGRPDD